jgi:hypothetical protein
LLLGDPNRLKKSALKGNQGSLPKTIQANFVAEASYTELSKGHGRIEKRVTSICTTMDGIELWSGLKTLIRLESKRQFNKGGLPRLETR